MRRLMIIAALGVLVASVGVAVAVSAPLKKHQPDDSAQALAAAATQSRMTSDVAAARLATAKYATNLGRATVEVRC
jgi:hypothetical protein